jgi:putative sugar O-methyltransferase
MLKKINEMFEALEAGPNIYMPSKFWRQLNEQNIAQLEKDGMGNMKRTLAQNYFTWVVGFRSPLFRHMASLMTFSDWVAVLRNLPLFTREAGLGLRRFYELQIFTRMVWVVAKRYDKLKVLKTLEEPAFGNPFNIKFDDRLISQDLANSLLEMYSVFDFSPPPVDSRFAVCELGAGYGRNAYVFLNTYQNCKYIIIDIPPALFVSQEYLTQMFPNKKIMKFSDFKNLEDVVDEFNLADVVFLLPHQAELLAQKSIDYFINISSFHEMTKPQVSKYFELIERITKGYFYTKQWYSFKNVRDEITIAQEDYPYRESWVKVYSKTPITHPSFFEALYKISKSDNFTK